MGGGSYDRDVGSTSSSSDYDYSDYTDTAKTAFKNGSANTKVLPLDRNLKCKNKSPIVVAIDGTGSMGNDAYIIYDKMPMFYGQILMQGYLDDPAISFAVVGDAYSDKAPIQVCDFEQGTELDSWLEKLWIEHNGGGQSRESYDLMAYYYANHCTLTDATLPFFFFIGDEGYYPQTEGHFISEHIGRNKLAVDARESFKRLNKKFNVFLIHKPYGTDDDKIINQWASVINRERILVMEDSKAIVDVMLGAIAILSESRNLDDYLVDMKDREQTKERIKLVEKTLSSLSEANSLAKVDMKKKLPAKKPTTKKRETKTKRT